MSSKDQPAATPAVTGETVPCPAWCTRCRRGEDVTDDGAVFHNGLTVNVPFADARGEADYFEVTPNRLDEADGTRGQEHVYLAHPAAGFDLTPAEARQLAAALVAAAAQLEAVES